MSLELTSLTWFMFLLTTVLWGASALLAGDRTTRKTLTWRVIPLSLFGFAWLAFGLLFVIRFLLLLYDPVYFGATNFSIAKIQAAVLSKTWGYLAIYWVVFCIGVGIMLWLRPPTPRIIINLEELSSLANIHLMDAISIITTILIVIVSNKSLPKSVLTPVGQLSSLYILPLMMAWLLHFQGQEIGTRRFLYVIPGIISYLLNPYREILLLVVAGICLPAMRMKKTFSLIKVTMGLVIFLLVTTVLTYTYRDYIWGIEDEYDRASLSEHWETWKRLPYKSPWVQLSIRFHGFDSMALTLYSVPHYIPFSERNIVYELMVGGFVPRMIMETKAERSRSREFSTSIWALGGRGFVEKRASAMIAPSMAGDLFSVNGVPGVILGALLFGLLVGLLETWVRAAGPATACIMLGFFGLGVSGALERDFVWGTATLVQHLLTFFIAAFIMERVGLPAAHTRTRITQE